MTDTTEQVHEETVNFTIDGRPFATTQPKQIAGELLKLAGLDPQSYDLGEVRPGNAQPKIYEDDDQVVHIKEGDRFVSVRESAPVA